MRWRGGTEGLREVYKADKAGVDVQHRGEVEHSWWRVSKVSGRGRCQLL